MKRRAGKFSISSEFLAEKEMDTTFEVFKQLQFVPCRVEYMYMNRVLECEGFSPLFEEIGEAEVTPTYEITVSKVFIDCKEGFGPCQEPEIVVSVREIK